VAVIGQTVATNLFPSGTPAVGQQIRVRNVPFTVVGVLAPKGSGFGGDQDDTVLIPFKAGQIRLFGATSVNSILVQADSSDQMPQLTTDITAVLRTRHKLQPGAAADFSIRNNSDLLTTVTSVSQTMTLLLGGVAAVSLVVGGIGIMNIMLVSVTERTREIGIRMAIGARGGDILAQFLTEAVVLAAFGGVVGLALGAAASWIMAVKADWPTLLSPGVMAGTVLLAGMAGIAAGFYPALRASRLDPIDALRYE
jgi:putative ABC transport system permease protein